MSTTYRPLALLALATFTFTGCIAEYDGGIGEDDLDTAQAELTFPMDIYLPWSPSLIAYYPFNGNAADASGYGNFGVPVNGATLTTDIDGKPDKAYILDGINDYIYLTDEAHFDLTQYTIAFYLRADTLPQSLPYKCGTAPLVNKGVDKGNYTIRLVRCGGATHSMITALQKHPDGSYTGVATSYVIHNKTWHHIAVTKDASTLKIYVDGALLDSKPAPSPQQNDYKVFLGRDTYGNYFDGKLDEVRFYNKALTQSQIIDLM